MSKIGLATLVRGYSDGASLVEMQRQIRPLGGQTPEEYLRGLREMAVLGLTPHHEPNTWCVPTTSYEHADGTPMRDAPMRESIAQIFATVNEYANRIFPTGVLEGGLSQMTTSPWRKLNVTFSHPSLYAQYPPFDADLYCWLLRPLHQITWSNLSFGAIPYRCSKHKRVMLGSMERQLGVLDGRAANDPLVIYTLPQLMAFNLVRRRAPRSDAQETELFKEWHRFLP